MTIETLGDRRNSGFCLMCGTDLLTPWNEFQCCSKCTAYIEECQVAAIEKAKTPNRAKRGVVVMSKDIARPYRVVEK
jgi:hypothetical protein